jgi:hypothetical protein
MALRKPLILRKLPTGPRFARPEDRLHSCLEGCAALIQPVVNFLTPSEAGTHGAPDPRRIPMPKFGASLMRTMPAC